MIFVWISLWVWLSVTVVLSDSWFMRWMCSRVNQDEACQGPKATWGPRGSSVSTGRRGAWGFLGSQEEKGLQDLPELRESKVCYFCRPGISQPAETRCPLVTPREPGAGPFSIDFPCVLRWLWTSWKTGGAGACWSPRTGRTGVTWPYGSSGLTWPLRWAQPHTHWHDYWDNISPPIMKVLRRPFILPFTLFFSLRSYILPTTSLWFHIPGSEFRAVGLCEILTVLHWHVLTGRGGVKGDKGYPGPTGLDMPGPQGEKGNPGYQGLPGSKGLPRRTGPSGRDGFVGQQGECTCTHIDNYKSSEDNEETVKPLDYSDLICCFHSFSKQRATQKGLLAPISA